MRGRRQGHGRGADLAQTILDKGDLFKRRPVKWLSGASVGRHGYFWEGVVPGAWRVRVCVRGNEERTGRIF